MPRTARDQSATGIYHVMIRGINRQDIFETPEDYRKFTETLASLREVVSEDMQTKICTCHIYAYCLVMGTGTHTQVPVPMTIQLEMEIRL